MKGFVFTEFVEAVESRYGLSTADQMIEAIESPVSGAYVSVDSYPHTEFVELVLSLQRLVDVDPESILRTFGEQLFGQLQVKYHYLMSEIHDPFQLLEHLDDYVHAEVLKLYPNAEVPEFEFQRTTERSIRLTYRSPRGFPALAHGLLQGCFAHYGLAAEIRAEDQSDGAGRLVQFDIDIGEGPGA